MIPKGVIEALKRANKVVVLTGAGISAESGVPTFRGKDGLWKKYRPEELATPEAFNRDPKLVWEWYNWRRSLIAPLKPNKAHLLLAKMEKIYPEFWIITQNIDGLHQKAGATKVIELHGNIWRVKCTNCGYREENREVPLKEIPPKCPKCSGILRPDVVWFGETLPKKALEDAFYHSETADVMLVIGTSAVVQPAASLPIVAKNAGKVVIEVNPEETPISHIVDFSLRKKAAEFAEEIEKSLNLVE